MQAKRARHRAAAPCCSLPAAANAGLATTQGHHARARAHAQRGRCVQKQHAVCCLAGCPSVWLAGWPVVAVCGARFVYTPPSPYRCLPCTMFHVAPCCPLALRRKYVSFVTPPLDMLRLSSLALVTRPAHLSLLGLRPAHRACIHHMSTAPAPLPDNSIKELVGDASTTESLLACKIGGCCGKDTPLLSLPVSDPFCPTSQLEGVHHHRDKPEPRLGPAQALHDRLSAIPGWRLSGDETVISRELC